MSTDGTSFAKRLGNTAYREGKLGRIGVARLGAEMTSSVAGLGGLILADSLLSQSLEPLRQLITNRVVTPHLKEFEKIGNMLPSLQTPEDKAKLDAMSPDQRAHRFAKNIVDYSFAFCSGVTGQIVGQMIFDRLSGVPAMGTVAHGKVAMLDRSIQLGAIIGLNTILSRPSVEAQKAFAGVLQKTLGLDEETAKKHSNYLINWQLPNALGAVGAVASHYTISKGHAWK